LPQRERAVGNREVVINGDGAAETLAGWARAERVIEAEESRGRVAVLDIAVGAVETVAE